MFKKYILKDLSATIRKITIQVPLDIVEEVSLPPKKKKFVIRLSY